MCKTSFKEYLILILKELHSLFDMKNNFSMMQEVLIESI